MGKSRKKEPGSTWCCCKSQKTGKQMSHRKFRRKERVLIQTQQFNHLPWRQLEVMEQWDLGGDGKVYWGHYPQEEWYTRLMRK